jgi:hypothetical protein
MTRWAERDHVLAVMRLINGPLVDVMQVRAVVGASGVGALLARLLDKLVLQCCAYGRSVFSHTNDLASTGP